MVKRYLLGEDIELAFDTGYIPKTRPLIAGECLIEINDNCITMDLAEKESVLGKAACKVFMTVEQAEAIKKALDIQIKRLGR